MTPDGRWIRLNGIAVFDYRDEARRAMLDANPILYHGYNIGDRIFEVFYIKDLKATIYSFTDEPKILED